MEKARSLGVVKNPWLGCFSNTAADLQLIYEIFRRRFAGVKAVAQNFF